MRCKISKRSFQYKLIRTFCDCYSLRVVGKSPVSPVPPPLQQQNRPHMPLLRYIGRPPS